MTGPETLRPETLGPARLWNKDFLLWWLGSAQSAGGSALSGIALSFLVLKESGSAGAMGVNLALSLLPALLSPLAGTLVDRVPLRLPLLGADVARGLLMLGVALWAGVGSVPVGALHALALLMGLAGVLYAPAAGAVLAQLVPPHQLARANGLMGTAAQSANLLGLVGGGLLVSRAGSALSLAIDGATFLIMAALLAFMRMPARAATSGQSSFWADFRAGLAYLRGSRTLLLIPVMALFINASVAPMEMLLPGQMMRLGAGAAGYGTFLALLTGGMVLGSALLVALGGRLVPRLGTGIGLAGVGLTLLGMAASRDVWSLYACAFIQGAACAVTNASLSTLLQTEVEAAFRGRIFSVVGMVAQIGMPLTLLLLAPIADQLAIAVIFAVAGGVTVLGSVIWVVWGQCGSPATPEQTFAPQQTP